MAHRAGRRNVAATAVALLLAVALAPLAAGGHGGTPVTLRATYETARPNAWPVGLVWACPTGYLLGLAGQEADCDPTGQTQDGSIDLGGAVFVNDDPGGPLADTTRLRLAVVDDVFGAGVVAATFCIDGVCDEETENQGTFCGDSGVIEVPDGWSDVVVWVWGPTGQALHCDIQEALGGTSGGVLTEDGGIFLTAW